MFYISMALRPCLNLSMAQKAFSHLAISSSLTFLISVPSHVSVHQAYLTVSNSSNLPCRLSSCLCMYSSWCSISFSPLISLSKLFNSSLYEFLLESSVSVTFWQEIAPSKWVTWEEFNKENIYEDMSRYEKITESSKYPEANSGGCHLPPSG